MKIQDINDMGNLLFIKIPDSKTNKTRSFTVVGNKYLTICRNYISKRPPGFERFFLKYQNGKCCKTFMGIHKIGDSAKEVASFLKLPNWKEFSGHTIRRTSATLLVDSGANITCLKRHGGWRSSSVAEGYIEESFTSKKKIAMKILAPKTAFTTTSEPSTSLCINESLGSISTIHSEEKEVSAEDVQAVKELQFFGAPQINNSASASMSASNLDQINIANELFDNIKGETPLKNFFSGATISNCIFNLNFSNK